MPDADVSPLVLAARLAARLCHDLSGPAGGLATAVELLADPSSADLHDDALALAAGSARGLLKALEFNRAAFGTGGPAWSAADLEILARGVFDDIRPSLDWRVEAATIAAVKGRILLNLVQIAAGAVAAGGVVMAQAGEAAVRVVAAGPRPRLRAEVGAGLAGEPLAEGLAGPWVQAWFVNALVTEAAGRVGILEVEGTITLEVVFPG